VPTSAPASRVCSVKRDTLAIDGNASPRNRRSPAVEVIGLGDLARGVALEGEQRVVARQAAAVVLHAQERPPTVAKFHLDPRGAGVEGVFDQLLHHRGRPLDHLAGGDLVGDPVGQDADFRHAVKLSRATPAGAILLRPNVRVAASVSEWNLKPPLAHARGHNSAHATTLT